jgi:hypothetical protein
MRTLPAFHLHITGFTATPMGRDARAAARGKPATCQPIFSIPAAQLPQRTAKKAQLFVSGLVGGDGFEPPTLSV